MIIAYQISCLRQAVDSVFRLIRVETFFLLYCVCFPARPLLFTSHPPPHFNEVFVSLSCPLTTLAKNRVLRVFGTRAYFVSLRGVEHQMVSIPVV